MKILTILLLGIACFTFTSCSTCASGGRASATAGGATHGGDASYRGIGVGDSSSSNNLGSANNEEAFGGFNPRY